VWRTIRFLHARDLFCRVRKRIGAMYPLQKTKCSSLQNSPYFFSGSQMFLTQLTHPFPLSYIVFIYKWTCSCPDYSLITARWTLSSNQLINQSLNRQNKQMPYKVYKSRNICHHNLYIQYLYKNNIYFSSY
jgi:hypothetical protein